MSRTRKRQSRPLGAEPSAVQGEGHRTAPQPTEGARAFDPRSRLAGRRLVIHNQPQPAPVPMKMLSVRAQNVLKELATELTGEQPPKGTWTPSRELLLALTVQRLLMARNCGPQTTREIIAWAQGCGVTIKPSFQAGRSLSEMWTRLIANAAGGALTTADVIEALQKSIRRKSARIPIAFQIVLVKILLSSFE